MKVFEHAAFPGLIIKLPSPAHAQGMYTCLQRCQQMLKEHPEIKHCKVPATKMVPLKEKCTMFVMEKVQGIISPSQAQEVSELAYENFEQNPDLEEKWRSFFNDAAEFICLTGYWDTSWSNIILMPNGLGFVDYERVDPSPQHIILGITSLLHMAPATFADMIFQIASKYGISSKQLCHEELHVANPDAFKLKRQDELTLRSKVRIWQKERQIKNPADTLDITGWDPSSIERMIIEKFNENVEWRSDYSPVDQRKVWWQPFSFNQSLQRGPFEAALKNLQNQGILYGWTTVELYQGYNIYF